MSKQQTTAVTPRGQNAATPRTPDEWDPLVEVLEALYGWLIPCMCIGPLPQSTPRRSKISAQVHNSGSTRAPDDAPSLQEAVRFA